LDFSLTNPSAILAAVNTAIISLAGKMAWDRFQSFKASVKGCYDKVELIESRMLEKVSYLEKELAITRESRRSIGDRVDRIMALVENKIDKHEAEMGEWVQDLHTLKIELVKLEEQFKARKGKRSGG
jgi:phage shock protein A